MIIGTIEMVLRFARWLSYLAHGRKEWLVVVQDYSARVADPHAVFPSDSTFGPDGVPRRVRSVPGWSGENPRYRWMRRMREHVFSEELRGMVPGYVETLPDRAAADDRAAEILAAVRAGRWSSPAESHDTSGHPLPSE